MKMNLMNHSDAITTKNEILSNLFNDPRIENLISKHNAGAGNEDLRCELFATLCEKSADLIIDLHTKGEIMYYTTRIIQNMIFQKNSKFHRTYRKSIYEYTDGMAGNVDDSAKEKELQLTKMEKIIETDLHWVEQSVLKLWQEKGSFAKISEDTGLPYRQIKRITRIAKNKIKTGMEGKLMGNYVVATLEVVIDCDKDVTPENILDLMDETLDYMKTQIQGKTVPTKTLQAAYIKDMKPLKVKQII